MEPVVGAQLERSPPSALAWSLAVGGVYVPVALGSIGAVAWWYGTAELGSRLGFGIGAIAAGLLFAVAVVAASVAGIQHTRMGREMGDALAGLFGAQPCSTCTWMALASGTGEELFFRGLLQPALGPILATALFAAAHVPVERRLWPWPLFALGVGAGLALLYEAFGGVTAPIVAHVGINAFNLYWVGRPERWRR